MRRIGLSAVIAFLAWTTTLRADDAAPAVTFHGWADGYYAWNDNHPHPRLNWFEGVGTSAHRADVPALNVAAFEVQRDPKPFGFHLIAGAGDSFDVVHLAEPKRRVAWIRYLYQASVSYTVPVAKGIQLEGGIYPSHIGYESLFTKDNWNYTRNWLGEFSPYYQSGVKASYAWSDRWSGQVHVLHGWQNISDRHAPAALGTQIAYSAGRLSASFNTYADNHRKFGDLVATYKTTAKLSLGLSADRGRQTPANWMGVSAYARYAFDDRTAIGGRIEQYRDPRGLMSGTPQTLDEGTLTLEYRPVKFAVVKVEARADHSTAPVFANRNNQRIALCGISFLSR